MCKLRGIRLLTGMSPSMRAFNVLRSSVGQLPSLAVARDRLPKCHLTERQSRVGDMLLMETERRSVSDNMPQCVGCRHIMRSFVLETARLPISSHYCEQNHRVLNLRSWQDVQLVRRSCVPNLTPQGCHWLGRRFENIVQYYFYNLRSTLTIENFPYAAIMLIYASHGRI
jgi:hypothetical protein